MKSHDKKLEKHINKALKGFNSEFKAIATTNNYPFIGILLYRTLSRLRKASKENVVYIFNPDENNFI